MSFIFLVGFMGAGKTTLAKKIASKLSYKWLDSDQEIEKQEGMKVSEIFQVRGEAYFREKEREFILNLPNEENYIVATGGGLPCFNGNMEKLNELGITIYLERTPKELFQRVKQATNSRPLIAHKSDEELLEYIETTMEKRREIYLKSTIIADRFSQTPEKIIELIVKTQRVAARW
jgi:shikimate kinase